MNQSLNPEQLQAVQCTEGPLLIIAGAGSGKTRVIVHRIREMIAQGISPASILALTFTNKAAGEMSERLLNKEQVGQSGRVGKGRAMRAGGAEASAPSRHPSPAPASAAGAGNTGDFQRSGDPAETASSAPKPPTLSTFHSFGLGVLRKHIARLGRRSPFTVYDSSDQRSLIRECLREREHLGGRARGRQIERAQGQARRNIDQQYNIADIAQTISAIKSGRQTWTSAGVQSAFRFIYEDYEERLALYSAVDYDDLIRLPIRLFTEQTDVLESYRQRYRYVMVDEFQDTSTMQYEFMKLLVAEHRNICVVGDDDQSIYTWRGADFRNIQKFESDFPERREITLEQNYRSTGTILSAANHIIQNNVQRKGKNLWTGGDYGTSIVLHYPENETEEAEWIVQCLQSERLEQLIPYQDTAILMRTNAISRHVEEALRRQNIPYTVSGGTSFFERSEIKDTIAYLRCISNHNDDINLLRVLNKPRRGIGKRSLQAILDRAQGRSMYRAMKELLAEQWAGQKEAGRHEQQAQQALFAGSESDAKGGTAAGGAAMGGSAYAGAKSNAEGGSAATRSAGGLSSIAEFCELIETYRPKFLRGGAHSDVLGEFLEEINYWGYLVQEFKDRPEVAEYRWKNIEYFKQSMDYWERNPDNAGLTIFDYLNRISLSLNDSQSEEGKLNLMTIHSAKGMEFTLVFIAGVEEGVLPHWRSLGGSSVESARRGEAGGRESAESAGAETAQAGSLEEERRLFYVALTRAKQKLYLSSCRQRLMQNKVVEMNPSRFLGELPQNVMSNAEPNAELSPEEAQKMFALLRSRMNQSE